MKSLLEVAIEELQQRLVWVLDSLPLLREATTCCCWDSFKGVPSSLVFFCASSFCGLLLFPIFLFKVEIFFSLTHSTCLLKKDSVEYSALQHHFAAKKDVTRVYNTIVLSMFFIFCLYFFSQTLSDSFQKHLPVIILWCKMW